MSRKKEVLNNIINLARSFRILDETAARNQIIFIEFEEMKELHPETSVEVLIHEMAEKYYLGLDRMREICYPKNKETIELLSDDVPDNKSKKVKRRYAHRRRD